MSYRAAWSASNDASDFADAALIPTGPVMKVTTYDVVATLGGETRAYTAEVVDPVLPGLQQPLDDRAPLAVPEGDRHVKTRRYAAVANRLKGLARAEKSGVPGRSPIGFLPGDDVTMAEEQLVMMASGVACGTAQVPTYLGIMVPLRYSDEPPAPYLGTVAREILDQNGNPINAPMPVEESYDPDPPSGPCSAVDVRKGITTSLDGSIFDDFYSGEAPMPDGCVLASTQAFAVTYSGTTHAIQTKYSVSWSNDGVTVTCTAGCR